MNSKKELISAILNDLEQQELINNIDMLHESCKKEIQEVLERNLKDIILIQGNILE